MPSIFRRLFPKKTPDVPGNNDRLDPNLSVGPLGTDIYRAPSTPEAEEPEEKRTKQRRGGISEYMIPQHQRILRPLPDESENSASDNDNEPLTKDISEKEAQEILSAPKKKG